MLHIRFPLSLRNVEDLSHERGVEISLETVRSWWRHFGPMFASEIRKRRIEGLRSSRLRWHLDEMFVKINGERHHLCRAVDHEGEVLECYVTKTRDKKAESKFLKRAIRKHGLPEVIVTDKLRSYGAALKEIGAASRWKRGVVIGTSGSVSKTIRFRVDMDTLPIPNCKSVSGSAQFQNKLADQTCQKKDKQYQAASQGGRFGSKHCGLSRWGGRENNPGRH